jgi:hypothetical protein
MFIFVVYFVFIFLFCFGGWGLNPGHHTCQANILSLRCNLYAVQAGFELASDSTSSVLGLRHSPPCPAKIQFLNNSSVETNRYNAFLTEFFLGYTWDKSKVHILDK